MELTSLIGPSVKLSLIYRGSRDGYRKEDFGAKCHDNIKTLSIIKSYNDKIFGGYTPIPWRDEGGLQKFDNSSFLFSIRDDKTIVKLKSIKD